MPTFNTFVKQVEINSAGGVRITVLKQTIQDDGSTIDHPHQFTIDTLATDEQVEWQIGVNNKELRAMGYPPIDTRELDWPLKQREQAHKHPVVKERRAYEKKTRDEAQAKKEADRIAAEEAQAKAQIKAQEENDAVIQARIDEAVAKAVKAAAKNDAAALTSKGK